jgi:hypothetical protein
MEEKTEGIRQRRIRPESSGESIEVIVYECSQKRAAGEDSR